MVDSGDHDHSAPPVLVRNRSGFRQPAWVIGGVLLATFLAWLGHSFWQDWADARAWRDYLADLDRREPNWRERVYGRPATSAEEAVRAELVQLNKAITPPAWGIYRTSLYSGFLQDPK